MVDVSAKSLKDIVAETLETNPELQASRYLVRSRDEEVRLAKGAYYPTVDANLGVGHQSRNAPSTGFDDVDLTRQESGIQARQLLFDGFATSEEVDRQLARRTSSYYEYQATAENIALRTAEVYMDVMRRADLLELAQQSLSEHQSIYEQMVLRNRSGVGSKADLAQIEARLALAHGNVIAAQNNLRNANSSYLRVTGLLPDLTEMTLFSMASPLPASLELAIDSALENHPTAYSAAADVKAAEAQYRTAKSPFMPTVHLEADKSWNEDVDGVVGKDEDLVVALRLRYNLYNGGSDSARKGQTAYLLEQAKSIGKDTERQIIESMRLSWSAHESIATQMPYLEAHVTAAASTKSAYAKQFNIGRRTLLDLLNTENEVIGAKRSLINAQYDGELARMRIMNSAGQLLTALNLGITQ